MSHLQSPVVELQATSTTQSLNGCYYQLVQAPGPQGKNVFNLVPFLKAKDSGLPVVASSTIPNTRTVTLQQPVGFALPSAVSKVSLPSQANSQLVQQIGSGKYIITTHKSPVDTSKTIRVNNTFLPSQGTAVLLDKSGLNLPATSKPGTQTIIMMNPKPPAPVKTVPLLPSGHGLQIPPHAEVKTVPASSLPFSIQQRILPQLNGGDASKVPSVIYVSPVNTVKTSINTTLPTTSNSIIPIVKHRPILQSLAQTAPPSKTESPKGPMKWVVQENTESASCIVPVTSSNDTASKLLKMMSGTKPEDLGLSNTSPSKTVQIKDNALVVCNNKIYLLTKQGAELRGTETAKPEQSNKTQTAQTEEKAPIITSTEAVLPKSVSSPTPKQPVSPRSKLLSATDIASKSRTSSTPSKANDVSEVIYIDDDDDDVIIECVQKPQTPNFYWKEKTSIANPETPPTPVASGVNKNQRNYLLHNRRMKTNQSNAATAPTNASNAKDDKISNPPNKSSSIIYGSHKDEQNKTISIDLCTAASPPPCGSNIIVSNVTSLNVDNAAMPPAYGSPIKDDPIKHLMNLTKSFDVSQIKEERLHGQPNVTNPINVYNAPPKPAYGSHTKGDHIHSSLSKTSSLDACNAVIPPPYGSHIPGQPNTTSSINLYNPALPPSYASHFTQNDHLQSPLNETISIEGQNATKPQVYGSHIQEDHIRPYNLSSIDVCAPTTPSDCGLKRHFDEVEAQEEDSMKRKAKTPVTKLDDKSLRAMFGLIKKEKVILKRLPLLRPESASNSRPSSTNSTSYPREDVEDPDEMDLSIKRRKVPDLNKNTVETNYSSGSSSTTAPVPESSSQVPDEMDMYSDPSGSYSYDFGQDLTGHFSEVCASRPRFFMEGSAYQDETTKDEKIQRLKDVLKEREQALEALRRLKKP